MGQVSTIVMPEEPSTDEGEVEPEAKLDLLGPEGFQGVRINPQFVTRENGNREGKASAIGNLGGHLPGPPVHARLKRLSGGVFDP